jgi:hypothetical protein
MASEVFHQTLYIFFISILVIFLSVVRFKCEEPVVSARLSDASEAGLRGSIVTQIFNQIGYYSTFHLPD